MLLFSLTIIITCYFISIPYSTLLSLLYCIICSSIVFIWVMMLTENKSDSLTHHFSSLQVFHVCHHDGRQDSFLCPNGTVFNQKYFVCDWWYNFNCEDAPFFYPVNAVIGYSEHQGNGFNRQRHLHNSSPLTAGTIIEKKVPPAAPKNHQNRRVQEEGPVQDLARTLASLRPLRNPQRLPGLQFGQNNKRIRRKNNPKLISLGAINHSPFRERFLPTRLPLAKQTHMEKPA